MTRATVNLFHDTRKAKKNGNYPVKLTVYFQMEKKRFETGIDLSKDEWERINLPKLRDPGLKDTKIKLDNIIKKASDIITNLDNFTFEEFKDSFLGRKVQLSKNDFIGLFEEYIKKLRAEERLGTADSYNTTLNSLREIKKAIRISEITPDFLKKFENLHRKKGNSEASIGIYLRNIRAIINYAISKKLLSSDKYPFKEYIIPQGRNIKKALEWTEIKKILDYKPTNAKREKAFDFWLYSYLCNGMNMTDIAYLTDSNIHDQFLLFKRRKTINTRKRDNSPIKVALHPRAKEIMKKYQATDNPYIFGILEPNTPALTTRNRIKRLIKFVNKYMKEIAEELKLQTGPNFLLTTYVARHTFATRLKRKGVSTDEIGEYLGHASPQVTRDYLDSFEDELMIKRSQLLTEDLLNE